MRQLILAQLYKRWHRCHLALVVLQPILALLKVKSYEYDRVRLIQELPHHIEHVNQSDYTGRGLISLAQYHKLLCPFHHRRIRCLIHALEKFFLELNKVSAYYAFI